MEGMRSDASAGSSDAKEGLEASTTASAAYGSEANVTTSITSPVAAVHAACSAETSPEGSSSGGSIHGSSLADAEIADAAGRPGTGATGDWSDIRLVLDTDSDATALVQALASLQLLVSTSGVSPVASSDLVAACQRHKTRLGESWADVAPQFGTTLGAVKAVQPPEPVAAAEAASGAGDDPLPPQEDAKERLEATEAAGLATQRSGSTAGSGSALASGAVMVDVAGASGGGGGLAVAPSADFELAGTLPWLMLALAYLFSSYGPRCHSPVLPQLLAPTLVSDIRFHVACALIIWGYYVLITLPLAVPALRVDMIYSIAALLGIPLFLAWHRLGVAVRGHEADLPANIMSWRGVPVPAQLRERLQTAGSHDQVTRYIKVPMRRMFATPNAAIAVLGSALAFMASVGTHTTSDEDATASISRGEGDPRDPFWGLFIGLAGVMLLVVGVSTAILRSSWAEHRRSRREASDSLARLGYLTWRLRLEEGPARCPKWFTRATF